MRQIKHCFLLMTLAIIMPSFGQTKSEIEEKPYIEVIGTAEQEIVPDQIYINITLREKYENKEKITIESQEDKLKTSLKEIGVDITNLALSDANADYVKIRYKTKDVLTKKEYLLKVTNATLVGQVFQKLDKLNINDAFIGKVDHSKMDSLKKELRITAIKAAKNKADYLLGAIGEVTGKALLVRETDQANTYNNLNFRGGRVASYSNVRFLDGDKIDNEDEEIQFQKIKIQASIYVKFSIK